MTGETSLSQQLKKLAAPQTSLLLQDKRRASLLFDPKEASALDRDTVFHIGSTGFDKLLLVNPVFSKFERLLFSENSKTFERSVQTRDANKRLDQKIDEFLTALSPYVLLRGAHESLEWLVYRFHIHMFNADSLISCVLPYYHSRFFVRVLQLVDVSSPSNRWHWLQPSKKTGEPLKLGQLLQRFSSDLSFRKLVCDLSVNVTRVYESDLESCQPVVSFSIMISYYSVKQCPDIDAKLVSFFLPYIASGLRSSMQTLHGGVYLIIGMLVSKAQLASDVVDALLVAVSKNLLPALTRQGLELIMLVCQMQTLKKIPKKVFMQLFAKNSFLSVLGDLMCMYPNSRFALMFLRKAIPVIMKQRALGKVKGIDKKLKFILDVLDSLEFDEISVKICFNTVMKFYKKSRRVSSKHKSCLKELNLAGKAFLNCLERRWPVLFDYAVESCFRKGKTDKVKWNLLMRSISSIKHALLPDCSMTLYLAMNHTNTAVRRQAVETVISYIQKGEMKDVHFVQRSLIDCITDENTEISLKALSLQEKLVEILPADQLLGSLYSVLQRKTEKLTSKQRKVKLKCLKLFCMMYDSEKTPLCNAAMEVAFPFLFPVHTDDLCFFECVLQSPLMSHPLLKTVVQSAEGVLTDLKQERKQGHLVTLHSVVWDAIQQCVARADTATKSSLLDYFHNIHNFSNYNTFIALAAVFIIQAALESVTVLEDKLSFLMLAMDIFQQLLKSDCVVFDECVTEMSSETIAEKCVNSVGNKFFPFSLLCLGLHKIVGTLSWEPAAPESRWWPDFSRNISGVENNVFKTYLELLLFLTKYSNLSATSPGFKLLIKTFIKEVLKSSRNAFWFLSYVWSAPQSSNVTTATCLAALKMADALSSSADGACSWFFDSSCVEFFALLAALCSGDSEVRCTALHLLQKLLSLNENSSSHFRGFANFIYSHKEEIKLDNESVFHVVSAYLSQMNQMSQDSSKAQELSQFQNKDVHQVYSDLVSVVCFEGTPLHIMWVILKMLQAVDSEKILLTFLPVTRTFLDMYRNSDNPPEILINILQLLITKFSPSTATSLHEGSEQFELFVSLLQTTVMHGVATDRQVQEAALRVLTKEFFTSIPSVSVQQKLLDILVCLYINSESPEINTLVGCVLSKLCVCAYLLLKELPEKSGVTLEANSLKEVKKTRAQYKDSMSTTAVDTGSWKKITVILEMIQNKKKLNQKDLLIVELFRLLHLTINWEKQPSADYIRQLILSAIFNCCKQLGVGQLEEAKFQVELIIQCIRVTDNPKTHQQCLLLLNLAAVMFPDYVLNNIMSIFTFMGSNLVRQDDSYSFQIISQTIETIVPALQEASRQKDDNVDQVMATVTRMFIDSIPDIPRHRQLPLFTKLVNTLGSSNYLWIPLGQICERYGYPSRFYDTYFQKEKNREISPAIEFAFALHEQFPITVQLATCLKLLKHLSILPDVIDENTKSEFQTSKEPFDLNVHTSQQLTAYKLNVLCYVNHWISSPSFLSLVLEEETEHNLKSHYESLIEAVLSYLQSSSDISSSLQNRKKHSNKIQLLYDLLNNMNSLLPCSLFVAVIRKLLKNTVLETQQKALEMLNAKLEYQPKFFLEDSNVSVLKLLRPLLKLLKQNMLATEDSEGSAAKIELNQQTVFYSLHLICRLVGCDYPGKFQKVLPVAVDVLCHRKQQHHLVINSLLCLAELCRSLNVSVLPYLNMFMPHIIELMEENRDCQDEYVVLGLTACVKGLVTNLGAFLSSYIDSILINLCIITEKCKNCSFQHLYDKTKALCQHISKEIIPRVLFQSVHQVSGNLMEVNSAAIGVLASILADNISNNNHKDLEEFLPVLRNLFIELLDYRNKASSERLHTVNSVEESIISAFFMLTLKLPESKFHSLYSEIYKWAVPTVFEKDKTENKSKVLTFYNLTVMLAKNLKLLFVPCAKKILRHAASVLDATNIKKSPSLYFETQSESTEKTVLLLNCVINALSISFEYDDNQLGDKDCFESLMQPLVDQIENELGGEAFQDRIENYLSPCLANFIVIFSDSTMWKSLNYQILLKTRHSSPRVRFASLKVIRSLVRKMSDNYLVLLPESIPFLAEIMEDESFEVEQECQDVLIEMEKVLGEPIKKYF